jgi:hypothetical protein
MPLSFTIINTSRNAMDAPVSQDWGNDVVHDLNYLYGASSNVTDASNSPIIPDGSFELNPSGTSVLSMTSWTGSLGTGATGQVTNAQQNHGAQSVVFTRDNTPGHSGGILTSGYFNVSPGLSYDFVFMNMNSRNDVENQVQVAWFTALKAPISTTTIYDSGLGSACPTVWITFKETNIVPPANAVYAQIIVNSGIAAKTPAATASMYWDGFSVVERQAFSKMVQYSSNSTFTVPAGVFYVLLEMYSYNSGNCYGKKVIPVKPGDTFTNVITSYSSATTYSGDGVTYWFGLMDQQLFYPTAYPWAPKIFFTY